MACSRRDFVAGGIALAVAPRARAAARFKVIVHPDVDESAVSRDDLARMFLKQTARWPNGTLVRPADLDVDSDVRREFTEEVIGRTVGGVRSFWQQAIFSGRGVPPPEFETDDEVVAYVANTRGGIGYVSAGAPIEGTRAIDVR
jgi:ABC-type phosphate transport system substrate-binding protein